jgi:hypothetical protein
MQNQQSSRVDELQKMINHLAMAEVASETFSNGLLPVAENFGKVAAALGRLYADVKGGAAAKLQYDYGYSREDAVRAADALDQHINKVMEIVAAVLLSKQ